MEAKLTTPDGEETVNFVAENDESKTGTGRGGVIYDFTTTQSGDVKITFTANGNGQANIADFRFVKINGEDKTQILGNQIARTGNISADKLGWTIDEGSTWTAFGGGGITCEQDETTKVYKELAVTAGEKYIFRAEMNDNNLCKIWLEDENGNVLIDAIPNNDSEAGLITIPANVEKVRIFVENTDTTVAGTRRVGQIFMTSQAKARLGDYNQSKTKYDNGAKLNDMNTCMDYAYYMLNNFWTDTNGDITQKTDLYKTLTLDLLENSDKYRFSTGNATKYDIENKNISADLSNPNGVGLFPLDNAVLGTHSDLTAPFGVADGELNNHNYHYGLKAHCQFLYDSSKNLEFLFTGDDDVYLFINGELAMDIGGAHAPMSGTTVLSYHAADPNDPEQLAKEQLAQKTAEKLGLVDGEVYDFDFFYLERHTSLSNMLIETNMPLLQAGVTPKVTYKVEGQEIADGSTIETGKQVEVEYSITSNTKIANSAPNKLTGFEMSDNVLGVFIGKDEGNQSKIELGDAQVDDAIVVTVKDADGNTINTITISKDDLENQAKIDEFVDALNGINLDNKESITISGISIPMPTDKKLKSELDVTAVAPEPYFGDGGNIQYKNSEVSTVPVTVAAIPVNEPKIAIEGKLVDYLGNAYSNNQNLAEDMSVNVEYKVIAKAANMTNIGIDDALGSGFVMNKAGITIPDGFDIDDGLVVTYAKANGATEVVTLSKTDIENHTTAYIDLLNKLGNNVLDAWKLGPDDTITVTGLHKNMADAEIKIEPKGIATGPVPTYSEETDDVTVTDKNVEAMDSIKNVLPFGRINVSFDSTDKGNITEGDATQTINFGESVTTPTISVNNGFTFKGWTIEGDNSGELYQAEDINEMTFEENTTFIAQYEAMTYTYTVKYVDENGEPVADSKEVENVVAGTEIEEFPVIVEGYDVQEDSVTETIDSDGKEIIFVYVKKKLNVTYKADSHGSLDGVDGETVAYGDKPATVPTPKADEGYKFAGWKMTVAEGSASLDDPSKETITQDVVFTALFEPINANYVVKYVDQNGKEIFASKSGYTPAGEKATEIAENIIGYKLVGNETATIVISENAGENVIVFTYTQGEELTTEESTTTAPNVEETTTTSSVVENPTTKKEKTTTKKKEKTTTKKKTGSTTDEKETTKGTTSSTDDGNTNTSTVSPKTGEISYMLAVLFGILFASFGLMYYSCYNTIRSRKRR